jgi:hypothetical protein
LCKFSHPCGEQGVRCYPAFTVLAKLPVRMLIWFLEIFRFFFRPHVKNADSVQKKQIMQAKKLLRVTISSINRKKWGCL